MKLFDLLKKVRPTERLIAQDGMAVTLDHWNGAHQYHSALLQAALVASRGWGILDGLSVSAAGNNVNVSPGVAVNPQGQLLVFSGGTLEMSRQIDSSRSDIGIVRVLLQPIQVPHRNKAYYQEESSRLQVQMANATTNEPSLEIARIDLSLKDAMIRQPAKPDKPGKDELDLRYRLLIGVSTPLQLALVKIEDTVPDEHIQGWRMIAREFSFLTSRPVLIDEWTIQALPSTEKLLQYEMICLIGREYFRPSDGKKYFLQQYLEQGGVLFYESCHLDQGSYMPQADDEFQSWINDIVRQTKLEIISPTDSLRTKPYIFPQIPRGHLDPNNREFKIVRTANGGVAMYSNLDYGCAFCGKLSQVNQPSRNDLRESLEWGHNLLAFAGDSGR